MWKTSEQGASLPEMLLALGVFSFFLLGIFGLFGRGFQAFSFLQARQSVQGEILKVKTVLESDFSLSHFNSVGVETQTTESFGNTVRRDNICCLTLDDWTEPANFETATGIPLWNSYFVYRCDLEEQGTLERIKVNPDQELPLRVEPLTGLDGINSDRFIGRLSLTTHLESFECERDAAAQEVVQRLRLRKKGGTRGLDSKKTDEVFEATFRWRPGNTVPRL